MISAKCTLLIVTFHTFSTADLFYRYAVHFLVLKIFMELLVNAVEFIVSELNFCFPVAIYTPSHAEI